MSVLRWFIPRPARIVMHPFGYTKRRLTPRPIRRVGQAAPSSQLIDQRSDHPGAPEAALKAQFKRLTGLRLTP